jgi:hypothetical protein
MVQLIYGEKGGVGEESAKVIIKTAKVNWGRLGKIGGECQTYMNLYNKKDNLDNLANCAQQTSHT